MYLLNIFPLFLIIICAILMCVGAATVIGGLEGFINNCASK